MSDTSMLPQPDRIDTLLSLLADGERRAILAHLQETPRAVVPLEELADALASHTGRDPEHARTRLHHCHLPKLVDTTILEYDTDVNTVRYRGHPDLECLLDTLRPVDATTVAGQPATDHDR